eukprot:GHVL01017463.1.p1 GENE.GHVL01017463.1~~GHVL01017463.1.p1  ORF type:complete len:439 (+),score=144.36 GHVL01017463.1:216-1532(+)
MGFDCSNISELLIVESMNISGNNILFTSNNTQIDSYIKAKNMNCIINIDDISDIDFLYEKIGMPENICLRYNPGNINNKKKNEEKKNEKSEEKKNEKNEKKKEENKDMHGNVIIGTPMESKFGMTKEQLYSGFEKLKKNEKIYKIKNYGLHTMWISNCINIDEIFNTCIMMFNICIDIYNIYNIKLNFINIGGGIGINYENIPPISTQLLSSKIRYAYESILVPGGLKDIKIYTECGRFVTGPGGYLITRVVHQKKTYKNYLGVDACMSNLMRPGMYGAYHHISHISNYSQNGCLNIQKLPERKTLFDDTDTVYDVVGNLCENNDKFAIDRELGKVKIGDLLVIHSAGAHGHSMGFNYNGTLRSAEYLLLSNNKIKQVRRAENFVDLFSTMIYPNIKKLAIKNSETNVSMVKVVTVIVSASMLISLGYVISEISKKKI